MSQKYFTYEFSYNQNEYVVHYNMDADTYSILEYSDAEEPIEVMAGKDFQEWVSDNNYLEMNGMSISPTDGTWDEDTYYITMDMFLQDYSLVRDAFYDLYTNNFNI